MTTKKAPKKNGITFTGGEGKGKREVRIYDGIKSMVNIEDYTTEETESKFLSFRKNILSIEKDEKFNIEKIFSIEDNSKVGLIVSKLEGKSALDVQNLIETPNKEEYQKGKSLEENGYIERYDEKFGNGRF